jgi:hypothetical protein
MAANTQELYRETDPREVFERWLALHRQQDRAPSAGTEENS